jgi:monoamine oxidase
MNDNNLTATRVDRRTVMKGLGAATVAAATPRLLRAQNRTDVVVIGAGLSGLAAALMLQDAGVSVVVVEGRDRVGGRVESLRNVPGHPETGGTGFGPGYARLVDAAHRFGVELIDITPIVPFFMRRQLVLGGEHISDEAWPTHPRNPFPEPAKEIMPWAYVPMSVAPMNPLKSSEAWRAPENAKYDISFHEFLRQIGLTPEAIRIGFDISPSWGTSSHDLSALQPLAAYFFSAIQQQIAMPTKIMGYTAKGGNQAIPDAMAAALKNEVRLNQRVTGIRSDDGGAEVHCADGTVYKAARVVCSLPCAILKRVAIEPMLSGMQARAVHTLMSQVVNQLHVIPKKPFWEDDGMTPNMFTDGIADAVYAERKGDTPEEVTSITAWIHGHNAEWLDQMPEEQAIATVLADLERLRPACKGQLEVGAYKSWYRDPFASGDWAVWQPGQVTSLAPHVATPHGRIHFCGEHTAVSNRGMEGAMESGERAAAEVLNEV